MLVKKRNSVLAALGYTLGLLGLTIPSAWAPAWAEIYTHSYESVRTEEGKLVLSPTLRYYSTTVNYGPDGTQFAVEGLQSYSRLQTDITAAYGLSSDLTLFGNFNWSRVQLESTENTVNFRPGDQTLGMSYRVWNNRGGLDVTLQGQVDFPLYDNEQAVLNGDPWMGDGSIDSTIGAFATLPLNRNRSWKLHGGAGYTYRTDGYSAALPWSAGLVHASRGDSWVLRGGFSGMMSLNTDARGVDGVVSASPGGTGAGGSYFIDAMNPSILNLQLQAGYRLSEGIGLNASFARSLWGQAAAAGTQVAFGIQASLSPGKSSGSNPNQAKEYEGSNQGFVSYAFEARVVSTNDRLNLVKIDHGSDAGVKVGHVFDIFSTRADGSIEEAVARAQVTHVKPTEAVLKIVEYFREVWIEERFIVKRPLN